jgi:hypothetical protein
LNSYAEKTGANWKLRTEDIAAARHAELKNISDLLETVGRRLKYKTRRENKLLIWEENGKPVRVFYLLASALIGRALTEIKSPSEQTVLVIPGGRAGLIAYKEERDPTLAERMKNYQLAKYRLVRALSEMPVLTRETFDEQIANDPVEQSQGQMMMF